jgi:hypothetical protein
MTKASGAEGAGVTGVSAACAMAQLLAASKVAATAQRTDEQAEIMTKKG